MLTNPSALPIPGAGLTTAGHILQIASAIDVSREDPTLDCGVECSQDSPKNAEVVPLVRIVRDSRASTGIHYASPWSRDRSMDEDDPDYIERLQDEADWQAQQSAHERSYAGLARPWWSPEAFAFFSSFEGTNADVSSFNPAFDKVAPSTKRNVTEEMREERRRQEAIFEAAATMPKPEYIMLEEKKPMRKAANPIVRRRVVENRQAGIGLPGKRKLEVERARPSSLVPDERPDVLLWGGQDILPSLHGEMNLMRRRGDVDGAHVEMMRDERKLRVPDHLQHFAKGWDQFDPDESDEERREAEQKAEELRQNRKQERLEKLRRDHDLKSRMHREKQSGASLLDRLALLEALETNDGEPPEKPSQTQQLADEWRAKKRKVVESKLPELPPELDTENIWWPDPVPAYLLEREGYYCFRKPKKPERWWGGKASPPPPVDWWNDLQKPQRKPLATLSTTNVDESSSDIEVVDLPPDLS